MKKRIRLYSLFEKRNGKWFRIGTGAYRLSRARMNFQNSLLAFSCGMAEFERALRPVGYSDTLEPWSYIPPVANRDSE